MKKNPKIESPGANKSGRPNQIYKMSKCVGCNEIKSVGVQEDDEWICEDCDGPECGCCGDKTLNQGCGKKVNHGCCSDGDCNQDPPIEALCGECGTWDEEDEVWRCPDCQEEEDGRPQKCDRCDKTFTGSGFGDDEYAGTCNSDNPNRTCRFPDPMKDFHLCGECMGYGMEDEDDGEVICIVCREDAKKKERLPSVKINMETLLEHTRKLQKENPEEYDRLNLIFQKCGVNISQDKHEAEWEEVYNSTDETKGVARDYKGSHGVFYQTYGNGGGKNGFGGYWVSNGGSVYSVAGYTYTLLPGATVEYRNQRSMVGICAAIRVDVNPPEPDGDGSEDE